ncbi:Imm1 family immunity protein [Streptomyces sp. CA-100214]
MIVEFWINGEVGHAAKRRDVNTAITRALVELESERKVPVGFDPGTTASFHVFDIPADADIPKTADNSLTVGVNRSTGYGGLVWWGEQYLEDTGHLSFVTKSENPPDFDPRVTADPCHPLWYDKQNVVPIQMVQEALEEFCFNGGNRPTAVEWEPSTVNGQRLNE